MTTQAIEHSLGQRFLAALTDRDFSALAACFSDQVQFRALVPRGLRQAVGPYEASGWFLRWFGNAEDIEVLEATDLPLLDKHSLSWRLRVHERGQVTIVEQHAFATIRDGHIAALDLVCSGFQVDPSAPSVAAVLDGGEEGCATLTPLIRAKLRELESGQVLEIVTRDPSAEADIASWSKLSGNVLLSTVDAGGQKRSYVLKK